MSTKKTLFTIFMLIAIILAAGCTPKATEIAAEPAAEEVAEQPEEAPAEEAAEPAEAAPEEVEAVAETEAETEEGGVTKGGSITIAMSQEPDKISTSWSSFAVSQNTMHMISDSLLIYDDNAELMPRLAVEIPSIENGGITPDGKTYTIKLRQDVYWQDGEPLTSADLAFTLNALNNPDNKPIYPVQFASLETPDDYTVVVTFENTNVKFLSDMTGLIVLPEHILKDVEDLSTADYFFNPYPGYGAYKFVSWERGSHIILEKNPDFYLGEPNIDQVIIRFISNPDATLTAIAIDEVDMTFTVIGEHVPLYETIQNVNVVQTPSYSAFFVIFNLRNPLLKDVRTRQALNYAIDREGINQTVVRGLGTLKWSPLPKPSWAWIDVSTKYAFDVEMAKNLLEEAGWKDEDGDGIREAHGVEGIEDGTLFAWTINNITGETERLQVCQILQQQWKEVGAQVEINTTDVSNYVAINSGGEFAMSYGFLSFTPDPSTAAYWYKTENALNWHGLGEAYPELEGILLAAEQTVDLDERKALYAEFQEIIAAGATNLFIYDRQFYHIASTKIHDFKPSPAGDFVWNIYQWWMDAE